MKTLLHAGMRAMGRARGLFMLVMLALVASNATPAAAAPSSITAQASVSYPQYIRVGRTFSSRCVFPPRVQRVDVMPFKTYVKSVLPNEWFPSWSSASLDAGAVAVAQFAYRVGFVERKWRSRGYNFDVVDSTCDQHYVSGSQDSRTNAAVDRTWGVKMLKNGSTFTPYYRANSNLCSGVRNCMSQWGSLRLGQQGYSYQRILRYYYGSVTFVR